MQFINDHKFSNNNVTIKQKTDRSQAAFMSNPKCVIKLELLTLILKS